MNQKIIDAIAKHLGVTSADIDGASLLVEDLGLGPVEIADLVSDLSQKFDVTLSPKEIQAVKTVDDLLVLIEDSMLE